MKFPKKVSQKVDLILKKNEERKEREKEAALAVKKRKEDLEKLKQSRMPELLGYAREVSGWLNDFCSSEDLNKYFSASAFRSDLRIFCDSFWQGLPQPKHSYCYATITVNKNGKVSYGERYKGMLAHETELGRAPLNPEVLISKLPPDYLKNLAEHLRTDKVWDYIDEEVSAELRLFK
ncbi:MAG: hypothetical protein Q7S73_00805 [bacterium]|nr:hypothetical protein [bacterium]